MPKDPKKNVDRYKVRGGDLNEYDFHQNQEEFAEQQTRGANMIPGTPPEKAAKTTTKDTKPDTKGTKSIKAKKGVTTKKQSTRKATKK